MNNVNLIIKGRSAVARAAAGMHGILLMDVSETEHGETVGTCSGVYLNAVRDWFAADHNRVAPYPAGALLAYSEDKPDGARGWLSDPADLPGNARHSNPLTKRHVAD